MQGFTEGSRLSTGGVRTSATARDPQPMLDLVEKEIEWPEGERGIWEREDIVEMVDALRDMFGGFSVREMGKGKWRGGVFYMAREWTWHFSNAAQGPRNLLQPSIPPMRSGRSRRSEIHSVG